MVNGAPSTFWPASRGAVVPTRPLGAAWDTSGCRVQPVSRRTTPASSQAGARPGKLINGAGLRVAERPAESESWAGRARCRRQQGFLEDLVDVLDQHQLHRLLDLVRDLVQVLAVLLRQDEGLDARPVSR